MKIYLTFGHHIYMYSPTGSKTLRGKWPSPPPIRHYRLLWHTLHCTIYQA